MKTLVTFGTMAAMAISVATAALAQNKLPAPVKARQAHMDLNAFNLGILGSMAKGESDYDAETAKAAAQNLVMLSELNQMSYWPEGTDNASIEGTRALPALWQNLPDVMEKAKALHEAEVALASTAGDGLDAVKAGLGKVGEACGACHKAYRQSDN